MSELVDKFENIECFIENLESHIEEIYDIIREIREELIDAKRLRKPDRGSDGT